MLKKLITFLKNNHQKSDINAYLDAKYIKLSDAELQQIATANKNGELPNKPASACPASNFIFHFGNTLILLKKDTTASNAAYQAELAWETDFLAVHSVREKTRGFHFITFEFDDNYHPTLKPTSKSIHGQIIDTTKNQTLINKALPVLKAFMLAISK